MEKAIIDNSSLKKYLVICTNEVLTSNYYTLTLNLYIKVKSKNLCVWEAFRKYV